MLITMKFCNTVTSNVRRQLPTVEIEVHNRRKSFRQNGLFRTEGNQHPSCLSAILRLNKSARCSVAKQTKESRPKGNEKFSFSVLDGLAGRASCRKGVFGFE
jgi:hypothetical protein